MMCSDPRSAAIASGRRRPCVSEMTPMRKEVLSSQFSVLSSQFSVLSSQFPVFVHQLVHLGMRRCPFHLVISTRGHQFLCHSAQQSDCGSHGSGAEADAFHSHLTQL